MFGIGFSPVFNQSLGGAAAPNPLWNDLVAYWTGDNTPNDSLGLYNGTLINGATYAAGKIGQGFSFDGINDYVDLGTNILSGYNGSTPISFNYWCNPTNLKSNATIVGKMTGLGTSSYGIKLIHVDNGVYFFMGTGIFTSLYVYKTSLINTSSFQMITATYDGSQNTNGIQIYYNGILQTMQVFANNYTPFNVTNSAKIGGDDSQFKGIIDEVGIWNRALTASEVTELYNSGSGKQYPL